MATKLFFIHIPKTGGTYVQVNLPMISYSRHFGLTTHATFNESKEFVKDMVPFTVVRNPYTWLESWYFFEKSRSKIKKRNPNITKFNTFYDFIFEEGFKELGKKQIDYIGEISKENILRTENLTQMLKEFLNRFEINVPIKNEIVRKNEFKEPILWSSDMKKLVYDFYREDFEFLQYRK